MRRQRQPTAPLVLVQHLVTEQDEARTHAHTNRSARVLHKCLDVEWKQTPTCKSKGLIMFEIFFITVALVSAMTFAICALLLAPAPRSRNERVDLKDGETMVGPHRPRQVTEECNID